MPIFQDQTGLAIKFFIQKDLPQDIQAEVCETIAALGGRVESKVPRAGYVLVQPGTAEEERLRLCWNQPDRPERFFVPYTYVNACKIHGMLLKQIFVHEGQPIRMHIDSSIANINVRAALSARIMHSGGDPTASAQSARVILADPNTEVFQHLVKTYQGEADKYVESYLWVKKCIEKGQVIYTPVIYKNPGGRRPGEERTQFSEEDEVNLCHWIAAKIPYKETGGRTGNRLYQQLCEMSTDPEYAWVTRHTWQSWRERYKKNSARLDKLITEIVGRRKPAHGEKGQYGYVRVPEERPKRIRSRRAPRPEGETVEAPVIRTEQEEREHLEQQQRQEQQELQELENFAAIPMPSGVGVMQAVGGPAGLNGVPVNGVNVIMYPGPPSAFPPQVNGAPINPAEARQIATEEEMEDEEGEWQVREGDPEAPQPAWAKRKQGETEAGPNKKRQRPSDSMSQSPEHSEASETSEMHVVDRAVHEIARQFRFTVEEVKEYYDKCGDAERTRARFQKMREALAALDDDLPPVNMS